MDGRNVTISGVSVNGLTAPDPNDARLIENGWRPIAVYSENKRPAGLSWQNAPDTIDAITAQRREFSNATSTGCRTGEVAGIDIDTPLPDRLPPRYSGETDFTPVLRKIVAEHLGLSLDERKGAKGTLLCYRNATPIRKIKVQGEHPYLTIRHKTRGDLVPLSVAIEFLGVGQQFVMYGIHPATKRSY